MSRCCSLCDCLSSPLCWRAHLPCHPHLRTPPPPFCPYLSPLCAPAFSNIPSDCFYFSPSIYPGVTQHLCIYIDTRNCRSEYLSCSHYSASSCRRTGTCIRSAPPPPSQYHCCALECLWAPSDYPLLESIVVCSSIAPQCQDHNQGGLFLLP